MENFQELSDWISRAKDGLGLTFYKDVWISKYCSGLYHYRAEIQLAGKRFVGNSCAFKEDDAIKKSLSEAVERYCCVENFLTNSNGCSVHGDFTTAKEIAMNELFERDAFLANFLASNGSFEKKTEIGNLSNDMRRVVSELRDSGFIFDFYQCKDLVGNITFCSLTSHIKWNKGFVLGLGRGSKALEKAILESLYDALSFEHSSEATVSCQDFLKIKEVHFRDHYLLALNSEYGNLFRSYIKTKEKVKSSLSINHMVDVEFISIDLRKNDNLLNPPFYFCKAYSCELQDVFLGEASKEKINKKRISSLANNLIPHPLS